MTGKGQELRLPTHAGMITLHTAVQVREHSSTMERCGSHVAISPAMLRSSDQGMVTLHTAVQLLSGVAPALQKLVSKGKHVKDDEAVRRLPPGAKLLLLEMKSGASPSDSLSAKCERLHELAKALASLEATGGGCYSRESMGALAAPAREEVAKLLEVLEHKAALGEDRGLGFSLNLCRAASDSLRTLKVVAPDPLHGSLTAAETLAAAQIVAEHDPLLAELAGARAERATASQERMKARAANSNSNEQKTSVVARLLDDGGSSSRKGQAALEAKLWQRKEGAKFAQAPLIGGGCASKSQASAGTDWAAREVQLKALPPDELRAMLAKLKVPLPKAKLLVKTLLEAEHALAPDEAEEEDIDALLAQFSLEDRQRASGSADSPMPTHIFESLQRSQAMRNEPKGVLPEWKRESLANLLRKGVRAKQDDAGRFKEQPEGGGAAGGGGGGGAFGDGSSSGPLNAKKKEKKKKKKKR